MIEFVCRKVRYRYKHKNIEWQKFTSLKLNLKKNRNLKHYTIVLSFGVNLLFEVFYVKFATLFCK